MAATKRIQLTKFRATPEPQAEVPPSALAASCLSTSGVRANPAWLPALIASGYEIHCGFDADDPGDAAADPMITLQLTYSSPEAGFTS